MTSAREVVVTGLGATTPLGGDVTSTWEAALAGVSGAHTLDNDWAETYGIPVTFAATIKVDPAEVLSRPETKRMDP
ncbi:MAG TPA: beta-ketoacyl synthase N-terminal-like domain-containing protein, partial [Promicromonospora sp.]|nr:beta-ketoacyl synthase N-terminal-like domain-containing protein [Promicromonospora sp.]